MAAPNESPLTRDRAEAPAAAGAFDAELLGERLQQHRSTAPLAVVATLAVALALPLLIGHRVDSPIGICWALALSVALSVRWGVARWHRRQPGSASPQAWLLRYRLSYALHGLVWMVTALAVLQQHSPVPILLLVFAYTVLTAGGLISASFDWVAGLAFGVPTLVPLLLNFSSNGMTDEHRGVAVCVIFLVIIAGTLRRAEMGLRQTVRQRLELAAHAQAARRLADDAENARQALADQHRLTSRLLSTTQQGCWFIDREGLTTEVNEAMAEILGRRPEDVLGHRVTDFFEGAALAQLQRQLALRPLGQGSAYEITVTRPDGSQRHCRNHATPLTDAQGAYQGSVGFWVDVTAIVETSRVLRVHEWALNSITAAVSVISEDGVYRMVNDTWCQVTGIARERALGHQAVQALPNAGGPARQAALQACLDSHSVQVVRAPVNLDKLQGRIVETFYYPYSGPDDARCVVMVSHDVTEEVRRVEQLRRSEAEQRALLNAFPGYIARLDEHLVYQYVNDRLADLLGVPAAQLVGRTAAENFGIERAALIAAECRQAQAGGQVDVERHYPARDGRADVFVQLKTLAGHDPISGAPAYYAFGVDVTAQHRAKAAMADAQAEAERANSAKSQFLAHMSHELRTPMNAILGFAQLLVSDRKQPLPSHQLGWVRQIHSGGEHLLALINEVLDLGRIDAGRLTLDLQSLPLRPLLQNVQAMLRPLAVARGVQLLELSGDDADSVVRADPMRLKQVLLNVVGNAIKYNRPGGEVALGWMRRADGLRIEVGDDGPGISPSDQRRLFEPFERLGAEHSAVEGTGIGLTLSRRLMQAMGGEIGLLSQPGQGSTFWLDLPALPALPVLDATGWDRPVLAAALPDRRPGTGRGRVARVLCIEDNPVNLMLMEAMLARLPDVQAECVNGPVEGLALALREPPDLVLLDLHMPELDGYEVLRRLRAAPATCQLPVCAVSANALRSDIEAALAAGFSAYLTKPLQIDTLADTVRRLLGALPAVAVH